MNIAVIGAGVIGCAIAHELASRGARVSVFERRGVARGASWASAGVLAPWIEAHEHGPLRDMCARSLALWDDFVERVRRDGGAAFEYGRPGTLEVAFTAPQAAALERTAGVLRAAGVGAAWLDAADSRALEPALGARVLGALRIDGHGFAEMPALVDALAVAARLRGAALHAPVDVTRIEPAPGGQVRIHTSAGAPAGFDHVVIAGGSWSNRLKAGGTPVRPIKGQLLRLRFDTPRATRVLWSEGCYMVPWRDGTLLVGATMEDVGFDERPTPAGIATLMAAAAELMPSTAGATFVDARAGLRPSLPGGAEGVPHVGPSPSLANVTIAAGHFRNGVLLAPLTAQLVSDQVLEKRHA